jgi:formylglycine-generating enzyme required for sulfatase activity
MLLPTFGWDNEYGQLKIKTLPFYASNHLISNGEFQEFVLDGGYNEPRFWTNEGWAWKKKHKISHPKFWVCEGHSFLYRAMFDIIKFPLHWPVEVNFFEAQAYCAWKGEKIRLLTEAEFERLAGEVIPNNTKDDIFSYDHYNFNLKYGSPCSIGTCKEIGQDSEFSDVYGNVWQWINNEFYPLPGFKPHYLYPDFSSPYFTPKHAMLKGGSWATTGTGASKYYRLWFRKHFFQHAGFRIAQDMK